MATLELAQTGFMRGRKCDVCIPTWKRGSNIKLTISIHYLRKIEPKSPQLCKSMFQIWKHNFKRLLVSRDQTSTKMRLTQKLQWKALKLLLTKTVCHPCNQTCLYGKGNHVTMLARKRGCHKRSLSYFPKWQSFRKLFYELIKNIVWQT